jgi:hypothetical protein
MPWMSSATPESRRYATGITNGRVTSKQEDTERQAGFCKFSGFGTINANVYGSGVESGLSVVDRY